MANFDKVKDIIVDKLGIDELEVERDEVIPSFFRDR